MCVWHQEKRTATPALSQLALMLRSLRPFQPGRQFSQLLSSSVQLTMKQVGPCTTGAQAEDSSSSRNKAITQVGTDGPTWAARTTSTCGLKGWGVLADGAGIDVCVVVLTAGRRVWCKCCGPCSATASSCRRWTTGCGPSSRRWPCATARSPRSSSRARRRRRPATSRPGASCPRPTPSPPCRHHCYKRSPRK